MFQQTNQFKKFSECEMIHDTAHAGSSIELEWIPIRVGDQPINGGKNWITKNCSESRTRIQANLFTQKWCAHAQIKVYMYTYSLNVHILHELTAIEWTCIFKRVFVIQGIHLSSVISTAASENKRSEPLIVFGLNYKSLVFTKRYSISQTWKPFFLAY